MSKEIYISSTPHETRLAIVENDALTEIYYERENEYTLAGSIYNGKVTRVLPGMQSSFVDIGLERDAFLYITDFMEEAPDSAEFETSSLSHGNDGGRENGYSRDGRLLQLEGQAGPQAAQAQQREGHGRAERNDSNNNRDRGRGQGRGERPFTGESGAHGERGAQSERSGVPESLRPETEFDVPPQVRSKSSAELASTSAPESAEVGEGAPGADGGRRWRGRRGRRRGRGTAGNSGAVENGGARDHSSRTTEAGTEQTGFVVETEKETEVVEEFDPAHRSVMDAGASGLKAERSAAPLAAALPAPSAGRQEEVAVPRVDASAFEGRGGERFDRGGRGGRESSRDAGRDSGRGRDRNERGGRNDLEGRGARPARVPRGFEPSRSLYGVDSEPDIEAPAEPIVLPGESLSKYRKGGDEAAPAAAPAATPSPSPLLVGWDGGSVLPGESLSRHGGSRAETRFGQRAEVGSSAPVAFVQPRAAVIEEPEGVSVAETPESQPEVAMAAHPEQVPAAETLHEKVADQPSAATDQPETVGLTEETKHDTTLVKVPMEGEAAVRRLEPLAVETVSRADSIDEAVAVAEYEPEEGFASYRVDPIAPSEYRQSAPVAEAEPEIAEEGAERRPETLAGEMPRLVELDTVAALPGHEVTTLNPMGDMVSLPVEPVAGPESVALPELNTPGQPPPGHETAVLAPVDLVEEHAEEFEIDENEDSAQEFAPGSGDLEEELIDEEEYEVAALHASYDDEMDDLEEETLDGAADLGTMLREMSIDQITRTSPEIEEEEFEEDTVDEADEGELEQSETGSEEYRRTAAVTGDFSHEFHEPAQTETASGEEMSYNERRGGRRDLRRGGRDRSSGRGDSSGRARNAGGGDVERGRTDRSAGRGSGRPGQRSMQSTNLPAISDLLKPGQEILVQIAKEPMAKKGARITSHIALPGRFLVFMPTVNHTGVSRKIESDGERRRLKEILLSEKGEASGGFIVRTAASGASEEELRSDLRFLLNLWTDIKQRSESSKSPALIYHDLNLVERILRDQVTDTFSAIWVDTETEYERVLRFLQRFQPSLIRRVKLYLKETPLFEQFGITEEINKALRSKVWLKSGGSIVINQTEALVAIDINTGKFVGKTARLEDTIVKTNLDAIPEIVRQIRLRDLGGIIIIDFIDMDERKNRNRVMAALEEELKSDRAPSKVLQFNDFGLVAITRKRVKQSLERTLSTTCGVCQGTGMTKSPVTVCNDIYVEMRKMHKHLDKGDVMLRVHPEVVKQLKSSGTRWLQEMEEMLGKTILVKSDPSLHPEQFDIH